MAQFELLPCTIAHLEALLAGNSTFEATYGLEVIEGYLPFKGALAFMLELLQTGKMYHPWLPYLFVLPASRHLIGFGGFKSPPVEQRVEIGYSVAPSYQDQGFATLAARQLIAIAFATGAVNCVCAHTLATVNPSTRVLQKCGMNQVAEVQDPEAGLLWRWEISQV